MKKFIKIALPLIFILGLSYAGYRLIQIVHHQKIQAIKISHIPAFSFKTLQGGIFTKNDLQKNMPILLLHFNSDCDYCQMETKDIVAHIHEFDGIQILFISDEQLQPIASFREKYNLEKYNNVIFLQDYNCVFQDVFDLTTTPCSIVYDKNGALVSRNKGLVKAENLLNGIKQSNNM